MSWYERMVPQTGEGAFWLAFCLCLLGGLFIIFILTPLTGLSKQFGPGHDGYIELAENLGRGNGYVFEKNGPAVFHRPPMYPILLVPITFLPEFFQRPALILMQSVMVGCIAALIFQIASYLFNVPTAQASVIIFLLNPWVYWNAKNPMTVILQGLLYTLFAVLVGRQLLILMGKHRKLVGRNKIWAGGAAMGVVAAALSLTHGTMLAVGSVLLLILLITAIVRHNYQIARKAGVAIMTMALLISPWTYRNWVVFKRFMPVTGGAGLAYFNGSVHWTGIVTSPRQKDETYIDASLRVAGIEGTEATVTHWKGLKDIELEDKINQKMTEHLRTHPGAFAKKVLLNAVEYYFPTLTYSYLAVRSFKVNQLAITIFNLMLWSLAFVGLWRDKKHANSLLPVGLMLTGIVLYAIWFFPFATFIGHSLYTFATMPLLSILAGRGLELKFLEYISPT